MKKLALFVFMVIVFFSLSGCKEVNNNLNNNSQSSKPSADQSYETPDDKVTEQPGIEERIISDFVFTAPSAWTVVTESDIMKIYTKGTDQNQNASLVIGDLDDAFGSLNAAILNQYTAAGYVKSDITVSAAQKAFVLKKPEPDNNVQAAVFFLNFNGKGDLMITVSAPNDSFNSVYADWENVIKNINLK